MKELLLNYVKYNLWANDRILGAIKNNPDTLDKEIISSFNSIRKTLYHLWDAETIWAKRLAGESMKMWPSKGYTGTNEEFYKAFLEQSEQFISLVENMPAEKLSEIVNYTNTKGISFTATAAEMITHAINHATFHRGQIVTMLRNAGVTEFPSTDYMGYIHK